MNWEVNAVNSKASYFSPSLPLFKENIRRFWAISALSFLVYFFTMVFPILLNYRELSQEQSYFGREISNWLHNYNLILVIALGAFPIITAVLVFRYLHSVSSVTIVHALPFTREKLYMTNVLSGLFLTAMPIILNGIILLIISRPVYDPSAIMPYSANLFSRGDILAWIGTSLVAILFVYTLAVLAGMISGNPLMHLALACLLNFLLPAMFITVSTYCSEFLFGYLYAVADDFVLRFSPLLMFTDLGTQSFLSLSYITAYVAVSVIIIVVGLFLYKKRKLERSGDSIVFHFMNPVVCYTLTFLGMTAIALIFKFSISYETEQTKFYLGLIIGAIVTFLVAQMIVLKTPRIFNLKTLKDFVIYCILATVFVGSFCFDITGYENRIPEINNIRSISSNGNFYGSINQIGFNSFSNDLFECKSHTNIKALQSFHKEIVEGKDSKKLKEYTSDNDIFNYTYTKLLYDLKNGNILERTYALPTEFLISSKNLKQVFESKEFKDSMLLKNSQIEKVNYVNLITNDVTMHQQVGINPNEIDAFVACIDKDLKAITYEEATSFKRSYAEVEFNYNEKTQNNQDYRASSMYFSILDSFTNTINWLNDNGYGKMFIRTADNVEYITLDYNETTITITKPDEIVKILNNYENSQDSNMDYVYGTVYLKKEKYSYAERESSYEEEPVAAPSITFNYNSMPKFLKERFEDAEK